MASASTGPARPTTRGVSKTLVAGVLVGVAAIVAAAGDHWPGSSSSTAAPIFDVPASSQAWPSSPTPSPPRGENDGPLGAADGAVPDGTTVFDDEVPAVANLDPELLAALRRAAADAADDGVEFVVNGGWRSPEYQERLLQEGISEYGSEEEAARWVATPDTSLHVSGDAVDLGPFLATAWLSDHGAEYGLCRTYGNEPWHVELLPDAIGDGCPRPYADPTQDPRMDP